MTRVATLVVAAAAFAVPLAATTANAATATITPSATDNLTNGQVITLSGSGFSAGASIGVIECATATPSQTNPSADCNTAGAKVVTADGTGSFSGASVTLEAGAVGTSGATCPAKTAGGKCYLIAANVANPAEAAEVALTFAPVITVTPSTGLKNGQQVIVSGYGFPAGLKAYVVECANPPGQTTCDASSVQQPTTDANGTFSNVALTVATGTWGGKPCEAGDTCLITATTDLTGTLPDASTAAPITFAATQSSVSVATSIFPSASIVKGRVKIAGAIESKGAGVAGLNLTLFDRAKGAARWHKVKSLKSGANGVFSVAGLAHLKHKEQYKLTHARQKVGTTIYKASSSKVLTVA
ncbi:MAG TPA: neocarzinostatin apoprotein domain-containing protein [Mycobacteriales bacterium]|nr:neocarzinostatin apoprotein domain-containing protein [Mycobacteriales bacterium]